MQNSSSSFYQIPYRFEFGISYHSHKKWRISCQYNTWVCFMCFQHCFCTFLPIYVSVVIIFIIFINLHTLFPKLQEDRQPVARLSRKCNRQTTRERCPLCAMIITGKWWRVGFHVYTAWALKGTRRQWLWADCQKGKGSIFFGNKEYAPHAAKLYWPICS